MSMTEHGFNLTNPLAPLPSEQLAKSFQPGPKRKAKISLPTGKPKPSKKRKPYFYNPADRD